MLCKPLTPNSENASLAGIIAAIRAAASLREHRRLLAFKTMMFVAELYDVTGRTLRNWTGAFNAQGLDGLLIHPEKAAGARIGRPENSTVLCASKC